MDFSIHENVAHEFAIRWNYALPSWPPADFDYDKALSEHKLRIVEPKQFRSEPDYDQNGNAKAYELEIYKGVYKTLNNKVVDIRPQDSKPCMSNFLKKSK